MHNYRVVSFDYRGFGESDSFRYDSSKFYYPELEMDLEAVARHVNKQYDTKANVLAFSMGTLICLNVIHRDSTLFDRVVFESLTASPEQTVKRIKELKHKSLDSISFSPGIFILPANLQGLMIAGKSDSLTSLRDVEEFKVKNPEILLYTHEGGHLEGLKSMGPEYFSLIHQFLSE
jgi:pimeloyl-ACP methyl ester carboxylesterase